MCETTLRPILFIDVDGVLNPWGTEDCPEGFEEHDLFPDEDEKVRLSSQHGVWLRELSEDFELVWASSWQEEANRLLAPFYGLPQLPFCVFPDPPFDPALKLPSVAAFAGDRPCVWVDDMLTSEAYEWAERRVASTLVSTIEPSAGLTFADVLRIREWAARLGSVA